MRDAVDCMLTLQNPNGGFASYEKIRGPAWLELLNPAEVFGQLYIYFPQLALLNSASAGDIMIEYCYPECTTSVITALAIFRKHYPDYRSADIEYVNLPCLPPIPTHIILQKEKQSAAPSLISTAHRNQKEVGSVRGVSVSRMPLNSRSRACR